MFWLMYECSVWFFACHNYFLFNLGISGFSVCNSFFDIFSFLYLSRKIPLMNYFAIISFIFFEYYLILVMIMASACIVFPNFLFLSIDYLLMQGVLL